MRTRAKPMASPSWSSASKPLVLRSVHRKTRARHPNQSPGAEHLCPCPGCSTCLPTLVGKAAGRPRAYCDRPRQLRFGAACLRDGLVRRPKPRPTLDARWGLRTKIRIFANIVGVWVPDNLGDGALIGDEALVADSEMDSVRVRPWLSRFRRLRVVIADLKRPIALQRKPTHVKGLSDQDRDKQVWVSTEPPVFILRAKDRIPSTTLEISELNDAVEIDEPLLERLKIFDKLRTSGTWEAYESTFSYMLKD